VSKTASDEVENRQELKNKRKVLFRIFLKNPTFTRLAIEIKLLDDQLAEWTQEDALTHSTDHSQRFQDRSPLLLTKVCNGRSAQNGRPHREQILTGARLRGQVRRSA
jgi:hypothetical protein